MIWKTLSQVFLEFGTVLTRNKRAKPRSPAPLIFFEMPYLALKPYSGVVYGMHLRKQIFQLWLRVGNNYLFHRNVVKDSTFASKSLPAISDNVQCPVNVVCSFSFWSQ